MHAWCMQAGGFTSFVSSVLRPARCLPTSKSPPEELAEAESPAQISILVTLVNLHPGRFKTALAQYLLLFSAALIQEQQVPS